jgi:hypothetical protein
MHRGSRSLGGTSVGYGSGRYWRVSGSILSSGERNLDVGSVKIRYFGTFSLSNFSILIIFFLFQVFISLTEVRWKHGRVLSVAEAGGYICTKAFWASSGRPHP